MFRFSVLIRFCFLGGLCAKVSIYKWFVFIPRLSVLNVYELNLWSFVKPKSFNFCFSFDVKEILKCAKRNFM